MKKKLILRNFITTRLQKKLKKLGINNTGSEDYIEFCFLPIIFKIKLIFVSVVISFSKLLFYIIAFETVT